MTILSLTCEIPIPEKGLYILKRALVLGLLWAWYFFYFNRLPKSSKSLPKFFPIDARMCSSYHGHSHWWSSALEWRHNQHDGVSNHQPRDCLHNRLFRRRSKITSKLRVTGLCEGNAPVTGEFPAHRTSNAENVSIWWRYHEKIPWEFLLL